MATVRIRLVADRREDLEHAIDELRATERLRVRLQDPPDRPGRKGDFLAYGFIELNEREDAK